ncbi:MAG: hypothetical protein RLZZ175_966 [Bacteroidota bacterium]|jgi:hypothetical protein
MAQLSQFQTLLTDSGLITNLIQASETVPFDTLLVKLGSTIEKDEREWQLEISFPNEYANALEKTDAVHFFVCLHPEIPAQRAEVINTTLGAFNPQVPFGSFGYYQRINLMYFRYTALINKNDDFADSLQELVWLIATTLADYSDVPLAAAFSNYSAEEILKQVNLV